MRAMPLPSSTDVQVLQDIRRGYDVALELVEQSIALGVPGIRVTTRLKTIQTLIEKLRRHPTMNLWQVQDIAGARVVHDMSLSDQDDLVARVAGLFEGAKIVDRRPTAKASHGYRAVHVIASIDSRLVEIQVRTALQDRWAQIVERLGDTWGRQIRYGGMPSDPSAPVGRLTRARVVQQVGTISRFLEACERSPAISCAAAELALADLASVMALPARRHS